MAKKNPFDLTKRNLDMIKRRLGLLEAVHKAIYKVLSKQRRKRKKK